MARSRLWQGGPVQDRYAGDVGDFLTFALLRWLTAPDDAHPGLSLGVLWYLTVDESHNDDGRHIGYADPTTKVGRGLRRLDPDLYDRLRSVLLIERSVAELERSAVLPPGTRTYRERLDLGGVIAGDPAVRSVVRSGWLRGALDALDRCDVVFADPDNGIRPADHPIPRHHPKSVKHVYVDELTPFAERDQALVVYHHADRSADVATQAQRRMADLAVVSDPIAAVRASRGTVRLFLVAGAGPTADRLRARLEHLVDSPWTPHLQVIWPSPADPSVPFRRSPRALAPPESPVGARVRRLV